MVNFDWGNASPGAGVPADNCSVRWNGKVEASVSGNLVFQTKSDDDARVWVDGVLVINNGTAHSATLNNCAWIAVTRNQRYSITIEYQDFGSRAVAQRR